MRGKWIGALVVCNLALLFTTLFFGVQWKEQRKVIKTYEQEYERLLPEIERLNQTLLKTREGTLVSVIEIQRQIINRKHSLQYVEGFRDSILVFEGFGGPE